MVTDYIWYRVFCTAKESTNTMKRELSVWENMFANDTSDKGLISTICKELIKLNTKKPKTPIKNGQRTSIDTSPKRTHRWPIDIWKNAQSHYSSGNFKTESQWDTTWHLPEWLTSINQQTASAGEDVEKRELPFDSGSHLWEYIPRILKHHFERIYAPLSS